jgi:hypothetical protein
VATVERRVQAFASRRTAREDFSFCQCVAPSGAGKSRFGEHVPTLLFLALAYEREHAYSRDLYGPKSVAAELKTDLRIAHVDGCFICFSDTHAGMCLAIRHIAGVEVGHSFGHIHRLCDEIEAEHVISADRRAAARRLRRACFEKQSK